MDYIKRILVVSRSTNECKKAFQYGLSLAKGYGAELSILHVINNFFGLKGGTIYIPQLVDIQEEYKKMLSDTKNELDKIIADEKATNMNIKEIIKDGELADIVIDTVKENEIDLVIIAQHDEGHIEHFLFDKGMNEITRKMPCSILLLKTEPF